MLRAPRDYTNSKIYIIESLEGGLYYIGSTCCDLKKRMANHRSRHMATLNGVAAYTTASEVMDYQDARISLVEDFPCDRKEQLDAREAHYIRHGSPTFSPNGRCVNRYIPGRSQADRYKENRDEINAQRRSCRLAKKEAEAKAALALSASPPPTNPN